MVALRPHQGDLQAPGESLCLGKGVCRESQEFRNKGDGSFAEMTPWLTDTKPLYPDVEGAPSLATARKQKPRQGGASGRRAPCCGLPSPPGALLRSRPAAPQVTAAPGAQCLGWP